MAGKCTLEAVLSGVVGLDDILKMNALLDMTMAMEGYANEKAGEQ